MPSTTPSQRDVDELKKSLGEERKRIDNLIVRINEVLTHARQNDDRIEKMVSALAGRVDTVARSARP